MLNGNEPHDFSLLCSSRNESISKMHLTKITTPTTMTAPRNIEGVDCNPHSKGDDTPIIQSVFLRLPFLEFLKFEKVQIIMTVLFGKPLWLVAPLRDIADPFNAVTRYSAKSSDGSTILSKGIRYEN
jgi:hypothetical protein